ncbi:MAG TPA: methyltransferase [Pseudonocardiaceae bacterium]|nr:methyltransferase [Pseudonocardiaceae bacterium]
MFPPDLERAIYGIVTTPVLQLADQYGIVTFLAKNGPLSSAAVAAETGLDADTLDRLLVVLVAFGVVGIDAEGNYLVPPETAPFFDRQDPRYIGGFVEHLLHGTARRQELIEQYLLRGKTAVDADLPAPYDFFYRDEESTSEFMDAMWNLSHAVSQELVELADLPATGTLVDVGGANGPFAVAALHARPELRGIVFDLPPVRPHLERSARRAGLADRLGFVAGDFFADELPAGDVLALGYVMSNWPDPECIEVLRNAHRACRPGGRVLVMERLFDDDRSGPVATAVMNLVMQVETRGRHRTVAEYFQMLGAAGFTNCQVRRSNRDKHLLIGYKA